MNITPLLCLMMLLMITSCAPHETTTVPLQPLETENQQHPEPVHIITNITTIVQTLNQRIEAHQTPLHQS